MLSYYRNDGAMDKAFMNDKSIKIENRCIGNIAATCDAAACLSLTSFSASSRDCV
jgi:hypothetical protein